MTVCADIGLCGRDRLLRTASAVVHLDEFAASGLYIGGWHQAGRDQVLEYRRQLSVRLGLRINVPADRADMKLFLGRLGCGGCRIKLRQRALVVAGLSKVGGCLQRYADFTRQLDRISVGEARGIQPREAAHQDN